MVTRIGRAKNAHLYIKEWQDYRGLSDEDVANRLETTRQTVFRWRKEQHRLDPKKIAALAWALDCNPEDLWRLPSSRPSLDVMVKDAPPAMQDTVFDVVKRLVGKG